MSPVGLSYSRVTLSHQNALRGETSAKLVQQQVNFLLLFHVHQKGEDKAGMLSC